MIQVEIHQAVFICYVMVFQELLHILIVKFHYLIRLLILFGLFGLLRFLLIILGRFLHRRWHTFLHKHVKNLLVLI